jgi:hypothetical protein
MQAICRKKQYALVVFWMMTFLSAAQSVRAEPSTLVHRENISASLSVSGSEAVLFYRLFGPVVPPLSDIFGTVNGQPLLKHTLNKYPLFGAKAAILVMLDVTDTRRLPQINRDKIDAFLLLNKVGSHESGALALFGSKLELAESTSGNPGENIGAAAFAAAKDVPVRLGASLKDAIKLVGLVNADTLRRDIVVFSDGHSDDVLDIDGLIKQANEAGVSISFIQSPTQRSFDADRLYFIAAGTGGRIIPAYNRVNDYVDLLAYYINSGGVARFSLEEARRFFWQSSSEVKVTFTYGDKQLVLTAPAPVPVAGPVETARYIGSNHPFVAGGVGLAVLALVAGVGFLVRRPRRAAVGDEAESVTGSEVSGGEVSERRTIRAVLQNIDDGTSHAISSERVSIGRAASNDIVIDDQAVSREHAGLFQNSDGAFIVENKGTNGTFVNHLQVDQAELAAGDLITIGDTTLRFMPTKT